MSDKPRPPSHPRDLTATEPLAALHQWISESRTDDAARARARRHSLEQQAAADATLLGTLVGLAEQGRPIAAISCSGFHLTGPVVAVGADFTIVRADQLGDVFVPIERLAVVRPSSGDAAPAHVRLSTLSVTLKAALMDLATERPQVMISTPGHDVRGVMVSVGSDLVTVATDIALRDRVHIRFATIDHVAVIGH